jgi:hypothetical protein
LAEAVARTFSELLLCESLGETQKPEIVSEM